jgi:polysaccharide deacetylase 2 family uncharacterized protein YibQ
VAKRKIKKAKKNNDAPLGLCLFLLGLMALILWAVYQPQEYEGPEKKVTSEETRPGLPERPPVSDAPSPRHLKIAILIDDIGQDLKPLDELLRLDAPIAFSVLPFCSHSVRAARRIHEAGREVLLHLPMEPLDYPERDPGKGVLLLSMNEREMRSQVEEDLRAVPFVRGVNNHMGSRFMQDRKKLKVLFRELRARDLYFIDSLTTADSKAAEVADETGVQFASREVFIDHARDRGMVFRNLKDLLKKKGQRQNLLVIGHPYPETIQALKAFLPRLRSAGVEVISLSEFVTRNGNSHPPGHARSPRG